MINHTSFVPEIINAKIEVFEDSTEKIELDSFVGGKITGNAALDLISEWELNDNPGFTLNIGDIIDNLLNLNCLKNYTKYDFITIDNIDEIITPLLSQCIWEEVSKIKK